MTKDPFENIRRIQEILNRINIPALQIQQQFEAMQPIIDSIKMVQSVHMPTIEVLRRQELYQFADIGMKLSETIEMCSSIAAKIETLNYFHNPIPDSIYPKLQKLMSVVDLGLEPEPEPREAGNDLLAYVTTRRPEEKREQRKLTWFQLIGFLMSLLMMIQVEYHEAYNRLQSERQHSEIMAELRKQTQIQQQQLLLQQEALEIEKAKLETENAKIEAMYSLMTAIETCFSDHQAFCGICHGDD